MSATHSRSGDDDTVVLWDANAVRLRRVELGAALQTLLDPLGRPLTVSGGDGLPAVRALCWLEPQADLVRLRLRARVRVGLANPSPSPNPNRNRNRNRNPLTLP